MSCASTASASTFSSRIRSPRPEVLPDSSSWSWLRMAKQSLLMLMTWWTWAVSAAMWVKIRCFSRSSHHFWSVCGMNLVDFSGLTFWVWYRIVRREAKDVDFSHARHPKTQMVFGRVLAWAFGWCRIGSEPVAHSHVVEDTAVGIWHDRTVIVEKSCNNSVESTRKWRLLSSVKYLQSCSHGQCSSSLTTLGESSCRNCRTCRLAFWVCVYNCMYSIYIYNIYYTHTYIYIYMRKGPLGFISFLPAHACQSNNLLSSCLITLSSLLPKSAAQAPQI